ncbi:MAG TPA: (d)CMP kinase [Chloroflexota bacterium]
MVRPMVVAIDGVAASGKSTVAEAVARRLGFRYVDTGVLYRALTWLALSRSVPIDDGEAVAALLSESTIRIRDASVADGRQFDVLVDGVDVTWDIRRPDVDQRVSVVAAHPAVREALLPVQRDLAQAGPVVMAGRDVGTVVFPDAPVKVFLTAGLQERAKRRVEQLRRQGQAADHQSVMEELAQRDDLDTGRSVAPLRPASDAIVIDTEGLTVDEVVDRIVRLVNERQGSGGG